MRSLRTKITLAIVGVTLIATSLTLIIVTDSTLNGFDRFMDELFAPPVEPVDPSATPPSTAPSGAQPPLAQPPSLDDLVLAEIEVRYDIDYRQTLADVIVHNSDFTENDVPANVFIVSE